MKDKKNIRRICCYAVLKNGYSGNDYFIPHMRLVLSLICKREYASIEVDQLVADFSDEYHYDINYFAMRKILGIALREGYVEKKHNKSVFTPTSKIGDFCGVEEEIDRIETEVDQLAREFVSYAEKQGQIITVEDAASIIYKYVDGQKLNHISGHIEYSSTKNIDFIFGKFVIYIKEKKTELFEVINKAVLGSILTDCLVFHEELKNTDHLCGLNIALDTGVIFIALGIDEAGRGEYYRALLHDLLANGAKLVVYEHTYDEMQTILMGSRSWVESLDYDPQMASEATAYFRSINAKQSDVDEFSAQLKGKITELGASLVDASGYDSTKHSLIINEKKLYDKIVDKYKEQNSQFNEIDVKGSIERDIKSVVSIYYERHGSNPIHLSDAKSLFMTTNQTLSKVVAEFHREEVSKTSLSPIFTDTFIGTYIWLRDPIRTMEMNEKRIISQAFLAFQPTTALLQRITETANKLRDTEQIDEQTCYLLKSSKFVLDRICDEVHGNVDEFREETPLEVLKNITQEAEKKGMEIERLKMQAKLDEGEKRYKDLKSHNQEVKEALEVENRKNEQLTKKAEKTAQELSETSRMFSEAILSALEKDKELISAYEEKKTAIEQKGFKLQKRMKIANGIRKVGILLVKVVLVAPVIVFLYFCYNLYLNNVNLLSFISILVAFIPWILLIIFEKTINPAAIICIFRLNGMSIPL